MWEIYAYHNADSLGGVFNALAAIAGADPYASALATVAVCGFFAALLAYAFAPHKLHGWQWLASVVLVYSLVFVPRVSVGIVDKTGGAPLRVIDHVPLGVAALGSITSSLGHTLTDLFETAFQTLPGSANLPAALTYAQHGLLFGHRLLRTTGAVVFPDPAFRTDLLNFLNQCTRYDLLDGTIDVAAFVRANDVWPLLGTPNPARFAPLTGAGGTVTIAPCPDVYAHLAARVPAQVATLQARLAQQANPTLPAPVAASVIAGQIEQAYARNALAGAATTAADVIRQNALLNALADAGTLSHQHADDAAAMVLAVGRAQALAQTNAAWRTQGALAEQALPVVRNVIEALAYALFPLVLLLLFITSGRETVRTLRHYAALLIWIQLWPPLYAILNYMATVHGAHTLAAAGLTDAGTPALAWQTMLAIDADVLSAQAVVGYLTLAIPVLAWALVRQLDGIGMALAGSMGGLATTASATAGAAASGNVALGNVAFDQQQLAPNRTSAFMQTWQSDATGDTTTADVRGGVAAVNLLRNHGYASRVVSLRVSEQDVTESGRQAEAARSDAVAAQTERAAVLAQTLTSGIAHVRSTRHIDAAGSGTFGQTGQALRTLDQITQAVADKTGMSQAQVAHIAFAATARAGLSTPLGGVSASASAGKQYQAGASAAQEHVLGAMTSEQVEAFRQFGERVTHDTSVVRTFGLDTRDADELAQRLATTTARAERASAAYTERQTTATRLAQAHERGETLAIDLAQDPHQAAMLQRLVHQYGGTSAAAQTLFEAELARQALPPTPTASAATALPASFAAVRATFEAQRHDAALAPPRDAAAPSSPKSPSSPTARPRAPAPTPGTTAPPEAGGAGLQRDALQADADAVRRAARTAVTTLATPSGVTTDAGTLSVAPSLLGQAARAVARDATRHDDAATSTPATRPDAQAHDRAAPARPPAP